MKVLRYEPTGRTCSCCTVDELWACVVAGVELTACPSCDRPKCGACNGRSGRLPEVQPVVADLLQVAEGFGRQAPRIASVGPTNCEHCGARLQRIDEPEAQAA